jgi:hypothetical protein
MKYIFLLFSFFLCYKNIFAQNVSPLEFHFEQKASNFSMSIEECIALIENEEAKFPEKEQHNTKLMLTRLRKIYYGFASWDKYLIKGVKDIKSPYPSMSEDAIETSYKNFKTQSGINVKLVDRISYPKDSLGNAVSLRKDIYSAQEVRLQNGFLIDIGHVLCGLDAYNHKNKVETPRFLGIPTSFLQIKNNMDAVTWIGDLGSFVAEVYFEKKSKGICDEKKQQELLNIFVSAPDMAGNLDAFFIAKKYNVASENGKKVSEIFREVYLSNYKFDEKYASFYQIIGFKNVFSSKEKQKLMNRYIDEISDAAAFYVAVSAKNISKKNAIKAIPLTLKMSMNPYAKIVAKSFFEEIERRVGEKRP